MSPNKMKSSWPQLITPGLFSFQLMLECLVEAFNPPVSLTLGMLSNSFPTLRTAIKLLESQGASAQRASQRGESFDRKEMNIRQWQR